MTGHTHERCPCCLGDCPQHSLVTLTDMPTGDRFRTRVPHEHRHTSLGWGPRDRVSFRHGKRSVVGMELARGDSGITAFDEGGKRYHLRHGTYETMPIQPAWEGAPLGDGRAEHAKRSIVEGPPEISDDHNVLRKAFVSMGAALWGPPTPIPTPIPTPMSRAVASVSYLLRKAEKKPGDRWITVHPNGKDEKGVPVLIRDAGDGTHRIIGGAGGKLTHLRLKGVKSEEEYKEEAKKKRQDKQQAEKERKAGQSATEALAETEAKGKEKKSKEEVKAAKVLLEAKFIEKVRKTVGGVDEALDTSGPEWTAMASGAVNTLKTQAHKKRLRQALKRKDELAKQLVDERTAEVEERRAVERAVGEDPAMREEATDLAEQDRALTTMEEQERKAERRERKTRQTAGKTGVGEKAAEAIREAIEEAPDADIELKGLGGRLDPQDKDRQDVLRQTLLASEEVKRRALQAMVDAKVLNAASKGEELNADDKKIVDRALDRAGVKEGAPDEQAKDALLMEAARQMRRAEVQTARSKTLADIEADPEKGEGVAANSLLFADMLGGIATSAAAARRMGLTEAERTPLQAPEVAEIMDLLEDAQALRAAQSEFAKMNKAAEDGDYDRSRRAFDLKVEPAPEKVEADLEEQTRQELTKRLLGVASRKRSAHLQAVANSHYATMADLGLSVGHQRYVDRPVMDAIGLTNTSVLMRHALEADGHDAGVLLDALEEHHVRNLTSVTADALAKASEFLPGLEESVEGVDDIELALGKLDVHEDTLDEVQSVVGSALGRMEATATAAQAFRQAMPKHMVVQTGGDHNGALQWVHAAGLKPGDYQLDYKKGEIRIPRSSWDKLLNRQSPDVVEARRLAAEIKGGAQDEENWMPDGLYSRARTTFTDNAPEAFRFHEPLALPSAGTEGEALQGHIQDHVGARLANGESAVDIEHDLRSPSVLDTAPDKDAYAAAMREVFPQSRMERVREAVTHDVDGHASDLDEMSQALIRRQGLVHEDHHTQDPTRLGYMKQTDAVPFQVQPVMTPFGIRFRRAKAGDKAKKAKAEHFAKAGDPVLTAKGNPKTRMVTKAVQRKASFFQDHYNKLASDYVARKHPGQEAVHAQAVDVDDPRVHEAMFRTLAAMPHTKVAFTPPAKLNSEGRGAVRDYFYEKMGIADTRSYENRWSEHLDKLGAEPDKFAPTQGGMFAAPAGDKQPSAEWMKWKEKAMKLSRLYPAEGKDLAMRLLGDERPESTRHPSLTDEMVTEIEAANKEAPWASAAQVSRAVSSQLGLQVGLNPAHVQGYLAPQKWEHDVQKTKEWSSGSTPWAVYVQAHRGTDNAIAALQGEMRGQFAEHFMEQHGRLTGKPLRRAKVELPNREAHVMATGTPEEQEVFRQKRAEEMRTMQMGQNREAGRYAFMGGTGSLIKKETEERELDTLAAQQQGAMFGAKIGKEATAAEEIGLDAGERWSLGERAENQIGSVIQKVGEGFDPSTPVKLKAGMNMSGRNVDQQRVIKMLEQGPGRMGGFLGTGAGKTAISIGAFTHMHAKGKVKHGLYLVPVAVQGQFGTAMLKLTEPGQYSWRTGAGLSHKQRVEMLSNPNIHMRVMTHQAFRETSMKLIQEHHGWDRQTLMSKMGQAHPSERASMMKEAFEANNIPNHFAYVDEAHGATHREGDPTGTHLIISAVTHPKNADGMLAGTATPHKNDTRELHSMAAMIDPDTYHDRNEFMQNYGAGIEHNSDAIRRELSGLTYTAKIPPSGVDRIDSDNPSINDEGRKVAGGPMKLEPAHQKLVDDTQAAYKRAMAAHKKGDVDVDAVKVLSPQRFEGVPEAEHEAVARQLGPSIGITKENALRRAIYQAPAAINTKLKAISKVVQHDLEHGKWTHRDTGEEHSGKPSIVFSDRLQEARQLHEHLQSQGVRSVLYHGGLSADEKEAVRLGFQPPPGREPKHDVMISTASGEAGLNLQRAKAVHHLDVPMTEKSHNQRSGRAYRQGQTSDVEVHNWHTRTDFDDRARLRLQRKTGLAEVFQTPIHNLDDHGIAWDYHRALAQKHEGREVD